MINSIPPLETTPDDESVEAIVKAGPAGALIVASIATFAVAVLWLAFYFFVFVPRGGIQ
jgi:hypothetical protein